MEIIIIDKRIAPNKAYHPYDIAYRKAFTVHESGTFGNEITKRIMLEEMDYPRWYDEGKNHVVDGMKFSRDVDCEEMFINVGSAEELFEYLKEQAGDVRFQNYRYGDNIPAIYIYDWY
jgi:hypothetical protein